MPPADSRPVYNTTREERSLTRTPRATLKNKWDPKQVTDHRRESFLLVEDTCMLSRCMARKAGTSRSSFLLLNAIPKSEKCEVGSLVPVNVLVSSFVETNLFQRINYASWNCDFRSYSCYQFIIASSEMARSR